MTTTHPGRGYSRRQVLIAALATGSAVVAGGVGAAVVLTRGGDDPPAQPTDQPTPTAVPTTAPGLLSFLEPATGAFERVQFNITGTIDWTHGAFFMDTKTGAMTAYRLRQPNPSMVTVLGPRFVVCYPPEGRDAVMLDRETGGEWTWNEGTRRIQQATESFVIFAEAVDYRETGRYVIASADLQSAVEYEPGIASWSRWWARGNTGFVKWQDPPDRLDMVDLATGAGRTVYTAPREIEGKHPWGMDLEPGAGETLTIRVQYYDGEPDNRGPNGPPLYHLQRMTWTGELLDASTSAEVWFESVSPDERYWLRQVDLFSRPPVGLGSGEGWPATVVFDAEGREVFRVRSAAITYGDNLPANRWLADGSGFVAMIADYREDHADPWSRVGYALVTLDGKIEPLPPIARDIRGWWTSPHFFGPVPSPSDTALISFGRTSLFNRATGQWFAPKLLTHDIPAHAGPWTGKPGEMVFALGHGGHDGPMAPSLVAPAVERAPFAARPPMRFRVTGTGSCLNLRSSWSPDAPVLQCLADGTVVELDPEGEALWENSTQKYSYALAESGHWVMVRAPGGLRGWVSAAYLSWAV